jgi:hypothetical protein
LYTRRGEKALKFIRSLMAKQKDLTSVSQGDFLAFNENLKHQASYFPREENTDSRRRPICNLLIYVSPVPTNGIFAATHRVFCAAADTLLGTRKERAQQFVIL